MTDKVQLINQCKEEISEEIEYHKIKGLPIQIMVHVLFKVYCKSQKQVFRIKRNILKNMKYILSSE